jgi:hypothetical protein
MLSSDLSAGERALTPQSAQELFYKFTGTAWIESELAQCGVEPRQVLSGNLLATAKMFADFRQRH